MKHQYNKPYNNPLSTDEIPKYKGKLIKDETKFKRVTYLKTIKHLDKQ
jgi:predicted RNA-binding protein with PUA-like domain